MGGVGVKVTRKWQQAVWSWFLMCEHDPDVSVWDNNVRNLRGLDASFVGSPCVHYLVSQRKVWNMRVFRLLVRGTFLIENLITLHMFE